MFPVLDVNGVRSRSGTVRWADDQPKYLNSPETPAYTKGEHLYGLFQAKEEIRQEEIRDPRRGLSRPDRSLSVRDQQHRGEPRHGVHAGAVEAARPLYRRVVINYDGDDAGIKAARRAIEHLLPQDFDVKVLVLPDGKDPDDFIRENGAEDYNEAAARAADFLRFACSTAAKGRRIGNRQAKG